MQEQQEIDRQLTEADYRILPLDDDEEEISIRVWRGSRPFTFTELDELVGKAVTVNGTYGEWRVIVAVHTEGGWGARLTFERVPFDEARELRALGLRPLTVEDRLAKLEQAVVDLGAADKKLGVRIDVTIKIAARDAVEIIRKELARVLNRLA